MTKKRIKFTIPEYREKKEIYELLGYKEIATKEKGYKIYVTFEFDEKAPHYKEYKNIVNTYLRAKGPVFFPIILGMFLSFILLSCFTIVLGESIRNGTSFDLRQNALNWLLPTGITIVTNVAYTIIYFKLNQAIMARDKLTKEQISLMIDKINK